VREFISVGTRGDAEDITQRSSRPDLSGEQVTERGTAPTASTQRSCGQLVYLRLSFGGSDCSFTLEAQ